MLFFFFFFFFFSDLARCSSFEDTAEVVCLVGFKMFLGFEAKLDKNGWNEKKTSFVVILEKNPLNYFVQLPEGMKKLKYSNIFCGVIRGCLEMVQMRVECEFEKDQLQVLFLSRFLFLSFLVLFSQ